MFAKSPGVVRARGSSGAATTARLPLLGTAGDVRVWAFLAVARRAAELLDVALPREVAIVGPKRWIQKFASISPLGGDPLCRHRTSGRAPVQRSPTPHLNQPHRLHRSHPIVHQLLLGRCHRALRRWAGWHQGLAHGLLPRPAVRHPLKLLQLQARARAVRRRRLLRTSKSTRLAKLSVA